MPLIPLSQGKAAIVDEQDFARLSRHKWYFKMSHRKGYAVRNARRGDRRIQIRMHNEIMQPPAGFMVDHRNRDSLDNRRSNLRICTKVANAWNRPSGRSGVLGVQKRRPWTVTLMLQGRVVFRGEYWTKRDAIAARAAAIERVHGTADLAAG
jgi:hypothetical protein